MATNIQTRIPSLLRATISSQNATRKLATLTQASPFDIQHSNPIVRKVILRYDLNFPPVLFLFSYPLIPAFHHIPIPIAKYGGRHTVTMLPGAGIGPEMMHYVRVVFRAAGVPVDFEVVNIDQDSETDEDVAYAITSIKRNGVGIKGNIETGSMKPGIISRNVALRNELDLYVNVLHCKSFPGIKSRQKDIDVVIIRQNTEGEYAMMEHESVHGVVENMKVVTRENSTRLARYAFEYARNNGRKKVTTVHKANIMKLSDGLFLETSRQVAKEYPEIQHNDMIIDNTCMQLVANPHQFDMINTTNLYGSIVSNVICGLIGGAGLLSGRNYGSHYAVFEPGTRNTGTAIAGKNIANPIAMLNASVDMLVHCGQLYHAKMIEEAIRKTICEDLLFTPDVGGTASSTDVVDNIVKHLLAEGTVNWQQIRSQPNF